MEQIALNFFRLPFKTRGGNQMLNGFTVDPDRLVFFGCMFGGMVVVVVNMMQ